LISVKVATLTEGVLKTMLFTKLKIATAGLLVLAFTLACGAGMIYQTQAAEKPKAEAVIEKIEPRDAQATKPTETSVQKVMLAYVGNDAKGDEEFLGHTLRMSGTVVGVQRLEIGNEPHYLLTLDGEPRLNCPPLAFVFRTGSQKQLAKLEMGQQITIEGVCQGRTTKGGDAITFTDCKIVKPKS